MKEPSQITVEVNGMHHALHLFGNPMEEPQPDPEDPNVLYFGPGVYDIGKMDLTANQTVYIAGEAERFIFPYELDSLPEYFGLNFSGYIKVPSEDVYTFSVLSNDGSQLFIADKLVVDNDGKHGAYEAEGEIALQKGWHKIKLSYFQSGGGKTLKVFIKSKGAKKVEIENNLLIH